MSGNPQGTPGVSAPGLPGATVIETGTPAPQITVTPTDTSGMTPSQARAMRYVDSIKPELLKGTSNAQLLARNREALGHVFHGEIEPTWLREQTAEGQAKAQADAAKSVDPDGISGFAKLYEPMQGADAANLRAAAVVYGVPPANADMLAKFCLDAQIPATHADGFAKRVAHHMQGGGMGPLSAEERAEYFEEASHAFGSQEKFLSTSAKARAYIESFSPEVVELVNEKVSNTSIIFDPRVLIGLAALADARGIK